MKLHYSRFKDNRNQDLPITHRLILWIAHFQSFLTCWGPLLLLQTNVHSLHCSCYFGEHKTWHNNPTYIHFLRPCAHFLNYEPSTLLLNLMITIFVSAIILFCFTGLKETAEDLVKRKKGWLNVLWVFSPFLAVLPQFLREMFVKTTQVICKTVCENCIVGSSYSLGCYNEKVKSFTLLWEWLFLWSMKFLFPMENPWIRECEGHLLHTILIDKVL